MKHIDNGISHSFTLIPMDLPCNDSTMSHRPASAEDTLMYSTNLSSKPSLLSLPPRSSSNNYALRIKTSKSVADLSQPYKAVFPSPPPSQDCTPNVQASKARDDFPFPSHSENIPQVSRSKDASIEENSQSCRKRNRMRKAYLTPPTSPERYIPFRRSQDETAKSFQLSKSPDQLSSSERILRHRSASPDPFSIRSPSRVVLASNRISANDRHSINIARPGSVGSGNGQGSQADGDVLQQRRVSPRSAWSVGGNVTAPPEPITGVPNGYGAIIGSGTNAPMFSSRFFEPETLDQSLERFEGRLAVALDIDQSSRILQISRPLKYNPQKNTSWTPNASKRKYRGSTVWKDGKWINESDNMLLDAPQLRDDFYCSILAYSYTSRTLAVGLHNRVYLWSEETGVQHPSMDENRRNTYVTSLSFSSTEGKNSILAIGRNNGQLSLWSLFDDNERFQSQHPNAVACLAFKPVTTRRPSERLGFIISAEELLVGDEMGNIYYYSIEWVNPHERDSWYGTMHLMAKIDIHTQQICGLAWSPDGDYFASGGNDNACYLFEVREILKSPVTIHDPMQTLITGFIPSFVPNASEHQTLKSMIGATQNNDFFGSTSDIIRSFRPNSIPGRNGMILNIGEGRQRHKWLHTAAVKAIAFCPWQRGLLATGGGSNDRAIHFYHAFSGACLATITVQAQVTSLIWSTTRREIAATFGYAQPEHPYRIAVFSWPDCKQVVAIPWAGDMRALYAIPYPGGPNETNRHRTEGVRSGSRTAEEGCIVVASSDESVKFHEVWSEARKSTGGSTGLLGGSDILEALEGIERESREVIR